MTMIASDVPVQSMSIHVNLYPRFSCPAVTKAAGLVDQEWEKLWAFEN
jgi:ethanolamine utilization microcompartment shell protein EutS